MLPSKTVFILGAGASKEVGLPIGSELKKTIADKLDIQFELGNRPVGKGDMAIHTCLRNTYQNETGGYVEAGWLIRDGIILSSSIDDFIDAHQHDGKVAVCGKIAIARSILEAERKSKLFFQRTHMNSTINFNAIDDTWYTRFYRLITKQVKKSQLDTLFDNITVISFNYDRCLEHFLVHAIATNYAIDLTKAHEVVKRLTILHPYGSVGSYFATGTEATPFGSDQLQPAKKIVANIRTYTEQINDAEELTKIRTAVEDAATLVFLGSAFHPNNMQLLEGTGPIKAKKAYATKKGISQSDLLVVARQIYSLNRSRRSTFTQLPKDVFFAEECKDLFDEYHRSLSV